MPVREVAAVEKGGGGCTAMIGCATKADWPCHRLRRGGGGGGGVRGGKIRKGGGGGGGRGGGGRSRRVLKRKGRAMFVLRALSFPWSRGDSGRPREHPRRSRR